MHPKQIGALSCQFVRDYQQGTGFLSVEMKDKLVLLSDLFQRDISESDLDLAIAEIDGWDSLKMVRLIMAVEQQAGRELSEDEMASLSEIKDVAQLLAAG